MEVADLCGGITSDEKDLKWLTYDYISFAFEEVEGERSLAPAGGTARRGSVVNEAAEPPMRLAGVRVLFPEYLTTYSLGANFARVSVASPVYSSAPPDAGAFDSADPKRGPGLIEVRSAGLSRFGPRVGGPLVTFDPDTDLVELSEGSFLYVVIRIARAPAQWDILNVHLRENRSPLYAWTHRGMLRPTQKTRQEQPQDSLIQALMTQSLLQTEHEVLIIFKGDFSKSTAWSLAGRYITTDIKLGQEQERSE
jgi:hypothetical protein